MNPMDNVEVNMAGEGTKFGMADGFSLRTVD